MEIKRDLYLNQLISHKHNKMIKIISGIRRCGKSYLLNELFKRHLTENGIDDNHIIQIALDTRDNQKYKNPDICNDYVKSRIQDNKMYYLLLDEVQMMDDFVSVLNGFLHINNLDVYVSGSNSKFLSTDIVTEFRGRGDEIRIYPLSFSEIYYSDPDPDFNKIWEEYSIYGGIPLVLSYKTSEDKIKYLNNLFKETYLKDLIERNKIKNTHEFEDLLKIIASNIGALINPDKLEHSFNSRKMKLTAPTIKQYMDYIQDAFFINKVLRYNIKGKKYINTPFKCYFTDIGLRNICLNFRQIEETHIMENIIYNELNIRGYSIDIGEVDIFDNIENRYVKKTTEIDFVANLGNT